MKITKMNSIVTVFDPTLSTFLRDNYSDVYNPLKAITVLLLPNNRPRIGHLNRYMY
jgi:hypothetical protein